jgi:spermidine/putrescine transport system permease protein
MEASTPAQQAARESGRHNRRQLTFLMTPALTWLLVFFMLPLVIILVISFLTRDTYGGIRLVFNPLNYVKLFDLDTLIIFSRSVWLAFLTTVACLIVGYPMAYFIARQPRRWRHVYVLLVIIPFWTNFLVRTYAIMLLLRDQGIINTVLLNLKIIDTPITMLYTPFSVFMGEFYGFLPFMVLPLYATLEKFDFSLMEAAHDAGANDFWAFWRVMVPLTMPGIVAGSILVFIPAIGAFVTPIVLGGAKVLLIGNLIDLQYHSARNWPLASAMSISLMLLVSIATAIYFRTTTEQDRL